MSNLSRLLNPQTIAVIGGKECAQVVEQCDKLGFTGTIWPVHPTRESLGGRACFRSVEDLPQVPDVAYVAVNRELTIDVVAVLSRLSCGGAVCYAAGFAEAEGEKEGACELQKRLVEAAGDMPIIGPNCYGFINTLENVALWPDQHGAATCDSGVAIITQSSNIAINMTMQKRGLPVAYVMTAGNQAQMGLSKLALGLLEDERVTALGLHIEGLDDVKAFEKLALRARELRKPIVAIKIGKSEQAQAATITHTASLAGSDTAHDALFKRLGIARVHGIETFIETLKLLHVDGPLHGNDLLSLSCSGGEASLMADAAEGRNISYRPYKPDEAAELKSELGDIVTVANPLDYNTFIWGDWPAMTRMFEAALLPRFDLALLVMDFPREDRCDNADWRYATNSFIAAVRQTSVRAAVVSSIAECMPEDMAQQLMSVKITPLCGLETSIIAAEAAAFIGKAWAEPLPAPLLSPCHSRYSGNPERMALDRRCGDDDNGGLITLDEDQSKTELASAGVNAPNRMVVSNMVEIEQALMTLERPVAIKTLGIAHKTEVGAVVLNLQSNEEIITAIQKMARLSDRFLVEEMAAKPMAELIVGVTRDLTCGLMLTIGAGGVLTELLDDTATVLLPASEQDIRDAVSGLKVGKLLEGYREAEGADINALIANIMCIAKYACDHANELEELDVNPLFATQFGAIAVDALIIKRAQ